MRMLWTLAVLVCCGPASAEIFIEHVYPPCIQPGQVQSLTLVGSEFRGASAVWTTLPPDQVISKLTQVSDTQVRVELRVQPTVRPGLYGLRLATRSGLSNMHVLAVDDLPLVQERETVQAQSSNNTFSAAEPLSWPCVVAGMSPETDVDHYAIDVQANERVSVEIVGNRLGKGFDPLVTILDASGRRVTESDNDIGLFFDSRFSWTCKQAGRYVLRVKDTRFHGSQHWTYMLRIGHFPAVHVAIPSTVARGKRAVLQFPEHGSAALELLDADLPTAQSFFLGVRDQNRTATAWVRLQISPMPNVIESEPNNAVTSATAGQLPANLHGIVNQDGDDDWYVIELKKGTRVEFRAVTRDLGSPADVELIFSDANGKEIGRSDDTGFDDAQLSVKAPADGNYYLHVREVVRRGGPAYAYRIEVTQRTPRLKLTSQVGRMAVPQQTWQPLPLTLERTDYQGEVELTLSGAPTGVTLDQTRIAKGETKLTPRLHVSADVPQGVYSLQLHARGIAASPTIENWAHTFPLIDRKPTGRGPHGEAFELREDQRRLPPSLTDRIALVVLPPAPFDFAVRPELVVLPRYWNTDFEIETSFQDSFQGSVTFVARGGTLEQKQLQMPTVKCEIPMADRERYLLAGRFESGVNTPLTKHPVTITGTVQLEDRMVHLTRVLNLHIQSAFAPQADPPQLELPAGGSGTVRIAANRVAPYQGPLTVNPVGPDGLELTSTLPFAAEQTHAELQVRVKPGTKPGRYSVSLPASARIRRYSEQTSGGKLIVVVK